MTVRLYVPMFMAALAAAAACSSGDETSAAGSGGSPSGSTSSSEATGTGGGATSATTSATTTSATATTATTGAGGGTGAGGSADCVSPADATQCGDCPLDVSFANDIQPILTASCAKSNCHKGAAPKAALDLSGGVAYESLVGKASTQCSGSRERVVAGDPGQSYVVNKLLKVDVCTGKVMPPAGALPADKIRLIADWICAGALDN